MNTLTHMQTDAFRATLTPKLEGSAYVIQQTLNGFNVVFDIANQKWWPMLQQTKLQDTYTLEVIVDEDTSTYAINDIPRKIQWSTEGEGAPTPYLAASLGNEVSAISELTSTVVGGGDKGALPIEAAFSAAQVKQKIHAAAHENGLKKMGSKYKKLFKVYGIVIGSLLLLIIAMSIITAILSSR